MTFSHYAHDVGSPSSNTLTYRSIFPRQQNCIPCPNEAPTCPSCKSDEVCRQTLGDCDTCPSAACVPAIGSGSLVNTNTKSSGPNIGAIVGGVIGGVAFIAIVVFCIWKFWLKGRRHEVEIEEEWDDDDEDGMEKSNASVFTREARSRASTHTVASMASTVLTRASNIIQIAYIPGVTNRSNGNGGSDILVPPVPPIPSAVGTPSSTNSRFSDAMLFMPGDLRDSTYSDMSATTSDGRRPGSIAPSLARTSMASTIFRDSGVINPMPATQVIGGKAAIIIVGSKGSTPASTPPVPSVDFAKHGGNKVKPVMINMPSSSSDGSNASGNLKTMKPVALNIIRKDKKANTANGVGTAADAASIRSATSHVSAATSRDEKRTTKASLAASELSVDTHRRARQSGLTHRSSHVTTYSDLDDEEDEHERGRQSLLDTKVPLTSPFTDAAAVRAATPTTPKANVERGKSPFDDPESEEEGKKTTTSAAK